MGKDYFPDFSPAHNIKDPVPTIYFLGDEDIYITVQSAKEYKKKCEDLGGCCIFLKVGNTAFSIRALIMRKH